MRPTTSSGVPTGTTRAGFRPPTVLLEAGSRSRCLLRPPRRRLGSPVLSSRRALINSCGECQPTADRTGHRALPRRDVARADRPASPLLRSGCFRSAPRDPGRPHGPPRVEAGPARRDFQAASLRLGFVRRPMALAPGALHPAHRAPAATRVRRSASRRHRVSIDKLRRAARSGTGVRAGPTCPPVDRQRPLAAPGSADAATGPAAPARGDRWLRQTRQGGEEGQAPLRQRWRRSPAPERTTSPAHRQDSLIPRRVGRRGTKVVACCGGLAEQLASGGGRGTGRRRLRGPASHRLPGLPPTGASRSPRALVMVATKTERRA